MGGLIFFGLLFFIFVYAIVYLANRHWRHLVFQSGFSFIETLISVALVLVVFLGIFGAYQLGIKVIGQSKARVSAVALGNKQMELVRNLAYADVGTYSCKAEFPNCDPSEPSTIIQGYPYGKIKDSYLANINSVDYTVETKIDYAADEYDGLVAPVDLCPNDYKKVKIKVFWTGKFGGEVSFDTIIAPKNTSQECGETGGILKVTVFNAGGQTVNFPDIKITNMNTGLIKIAKPESGIAYITLPPDVSAYKIEVSKDGYSSERTFNSGETYEGKVIIIPDKPQATIIEGELTETSFSIDKVSSLLVKTYFEGGETSFIDSFFDSSQIIESSNIVVSNGEIKLAKVSESEYFETGYFISQTIDPLGLVQWNEFDFTDDTPPQTKVRYQVLYLNGSAWELISDSDLPGNSAGLHKPPIDLSRMDITTYPKIRLQATLFSSSSSKTPIVYDWQVSWLSSNPTAIANVAFGLRGQKIVGKDADSQPIYKYSKNLQTSNGSLSISNLEWDIYNFSVDKALTGLDLVRTDPIQPINLAPDVLQETNLYLRAENSLLVNVKNSANDNPIFSANVRLYNISLNYDQSLLTDENGQAFFIPLQAGNYNLEVKAAGYADYNSSISISGTINKTVNLMLQ